MEATDNSIAADLAAFRASNKVFEYRATSFGKFAGHKLARSKHANLVYIGRKHEPSERTSQSDLRYVNYRANAKGLWGAEVIVVTTPWQAGQTKRVAYMADGSECWIESR